MNVNKVFKTETNGALINSSALFRVLLALNKRIHCQLDLEMAGLSKICKT